ncbi:MAG: hypothetical protein LQ345_004126 [Seirophora villosa]|nr:MAG: hypothetical protein LQ345_004126 [Seirophora villosa]
MDPSVVGSPQFGQLWTSKLPGDYRGSLEQIFHQPLVYTLDDGIQYVFIATSQNNVYKINAKTGTIVASRNLHIPFLTQEIIPCLDINPNVGVTGTGVIDPSTDTWYLAAKTYEDQTDQVKGLDNGRYFFHAIDVNTLDEKPGFPKPLEGTIAKNNPKRVFQGGKHLQRPALLLSGQYVYAAFASHCVQYNFTGWVMGWDKTSGAIVERFSTQGGLEPVTVPGGGIWMSGGGLATDGKGSMYYSTGNGYASQLHGNPVPGRQPPTALEEAVVNMKINDDGSLTTVDFFMPWEKEQLDGADKDLGTTPFELLPPETFTCPNAKRMGVVTGKSGKTYILNLDNLGGYQMGANKLDAIPQEAIQNENSVYAGAGVYPLEGGYIYINVIQYQTHVFKFSCDSSGYPAFTKVADSPEKAAYVLGVGHGATTSFNGQSGTGLYWMTDVDGYNLRIYNAVPKSGVLELIKSANIPGVTKFSRPVFGDGRAYVGTVQGLLYAFGSPVNLPLTCTSPNDFGKISIDSTSAVRTIQCQANTYTQVKSITLNNTANFQISGLPSLPVDLPAGQNISFNAVFKPTAPGPLSVDVTVLTSSGDDKFSPRTPVSLKGVGTSAKPLLAVNPNAVTFNGVIVDQNDNGATESVIFSNLGDGVLAIQGLDYSISSEKGPFITPNTTAAGVQVGPFTFTNIPTTIAGNSDSIVKINFNPVKTGNYAVYVRVRSDGGSKIFDVFGTASSAPSALLEFEAADGSGRWIPYTQNSPPFTFGNVFEAQTKSLKMRLTNNGSSSAGSLSVTVSKPPFGSAGIVGAQNGADLGEGTNLAAGQSATAVLFCSVPKSQVNMDSYNGSATWVMNLGDLNFGKQSIQFTCTAITEQVGPLAANGSAIYRYGGCYKENDPDRQLKVQLFGKDETMTNDKCVSACAAAGYAIAASEYVNECWCGNRFPKTLADEVDCNYVCAGNSSQTCGGNGYFHDHSHMSLFSNGKAQPPLPNVPPSVQPSYGAYNYSGCYTEGVGGRALADKQIASDEMTVATCGTFCSGYQYFGIEYRSECFCGDMIGNRAAKAPETDCRLTCSGNSTQYCGGGNRLTVYGRGKISSSSSSSSSGGSPTSTGSSTSTSASTSSSGTPGAPTAVPSVAGFVSQGCYTEGSSGRALGEAATASSAMTVEKCAAFCSSYTYFGVEYQSECYCGNTIGTGAILATDNGCTMACGGNPGQLCGGPSRLNFYKSNKSSASSSTVTSTTSTSSTGTSTSATSTPTSTGPAIVLTASPFAYQGCYSEGSAGRALSATSTASGTMTIQMCAAFCKEYAYMGVEYSTECYCGNTIGTGSALVTDGRCSMTCGGAPSAICGGPNGLSFYKNTGSASSSGSSTASSTSTSTSTSASATATGPMTVQSVPGYGYLGCYSEVAGGRALTDLANPIAGDKVSVDACGVACSAYTYFGVEYSGECYCGNSINTGSAPVAGTDPASTQCNMLCNANKNQYCGGPDRLNMYKKGLYFINDHKFDGLNHISQINKFHVVNRISQLDQFDVVNHFHQLNNFIRYHISQGDKFSNHFISNNVDIVNKFTHYYVQVFNNNSQLELNLQDGSSTTTASSSSTSKTGTSTTSSQTSGPTIVQSNVNFTYTGCYTEGSSVRALKNLALASDTMTVGICLEKCSDYQYAGIEYGRECWCDNTIDSTSTIAPLESQCNKKCPGDQTQICGGSSRLTLYTRKPASGARIAQLQAATPSGASTSPTTSGSSTSPTSTRTSSSSRPSTTSSSISTTATSSSSSTTRTSTTATSSSSSTTRTSTTSSTLYPTPSLTLSSHTYLGCANATNPLALNAVAKTSTSMDLETCHTLCTSYNYGLAGLQNGDTCYCGNGLQSYSALQNEQNTLAKDSKCNLPCAGNATEICGAKEYLSVWNATESVKIPPTTVKQVGYYPLKGCYNGTISSTTKPLLNAASTSLPTTNSAESCVGYCATRGFAVAGMDNGSACRCGASLSSDAEELTLGECNVVCAGNKREFCGGKEGKTTVYVMDTGSVNAEGQPKSLGQSNEANVKPAA